MLWAARMAVHGRSIAWLQGVLKGLPQWRALRKTAPSLAAARLIALLHASERQIQEDRGARDRFWRIYFSLFG
jgi:hypothetical protein